MKQLMTFTKLELINIFGRNVNRYVKDPAQKKRQRLMLALYIVLILILMGYLVSGAYAMARFGAAEKIPMIYSLFSGVFTLIIGIFKAKSVLYREKDLVLLASLPVKSSPIVAARLIRAYTENAILNALVILPTFVICAIYAKPGAVFYIYLVLALIVLPILPTVLMAWFGMLFSAIISRIRHKALAETVLALLTVLLLTLFTALTGSAGMSSSLGRISFSSGTDTAEAERLMAEQISEVFGRLEASAPILSRWNGFFFGTDIAGLPLYGLISLILAGFSAAYIGRYFFTISAGLFPATGHSEFHMKAMHSESVLRALVRKEAGRYFSSGIYVSNTIIGPFMALILAVSLAFWDPATVLKGAEKLPVDLNLPAALPFLIGMVFSMMTLTASSVSMEGKNWWIVKSLPLAHKDILHAKLLFNLLVVAPFYALSELIMLFTVHASLAERLWLILAPAASILFSVCFGLFANLKFPRFDWGSATEVVKQGAAAGLSILATFVSVLPALGLMLMPAEYSVAATPACIALIVLLTFLIYKKIRKTDLAKLA